MRLFLFLSIWIGLAFFSDRSVAEFTPGTTIILWSKLRDTPVGQDQALVNDLVKQGFDRSRLKLVEVSYLNIGDGTATTTEEQLFHSIELQMMGVEKISTLIFSDSGKGSGWLPSGRVTTQLMSGFDSMGPRGLFDRFLKTYGAQFTSDFHLFLNRVIPFGWGKQHALWQTRGLAESLWESGVENVSIWGSRKQATTLPSTQVASAGTAVIRRLKVQVRELWRKNGAVSVLLGVGFPFLMHVDGWSSRVASALGVSAFGFIYINLMEVLDWYWTKYRHLGKQGYFILFGEDGSELVVDSLQDSPEALGLQKVRACLL